MWWGACFVGLWLLSAPIMLWTPSAAAYVNDTLVGTLVVALTIVLPGIPNEPAFESKGKATPPGWSYNPSSWPQRLILIAVACVGLFASRYLAAYQLGYVDEVWDPFFGFSEGTQRVLDSELSHAFPVSDAGLGAIAYNLEILAVLGGNAARWRTSPWTVAIFGVLVLPLGLAHVALIMSMPVIVQAWCTLCLVAGAVALPMVVFAVDEVVAMGQHLRRAREQGDRGGSTWKVFWLGSTSEGSTADGRTPQMLDLGERPIRVVGASLWGPAHAYRYWALWLSASCSMPHPASTVWSRVNPRPRWRTSEGPCSLSSRPWQWPRSSDRHACWLWWPGRRWQCPYGSQERGRRSRFLSLASAS